MVSLVKVAMVDDTMVEEILALLDTNMWENDILSGLTDRDY
jgi:hypothetical protein